MNSRNTADSEQIDRQKSRSICDAIGERLRQTLRPESLRHSSHLDHLMDELRWRGRGRRSRLPTFSTNFCGSQVIVGLMAVGWVCGMNRERFDHRAVAWAWLARAWRPRHKFRIALTDAS